MPHCGPSFRRYYGHEFQAQFHWHVEDQGMIHRYIKPRTPRLNGKVERSHLTDKEEFYQLPTYTDDVDLNEMLREWESFYNYHRPHSAHNGKTPYEVLKEKMQASSQRSVEPAELKEVAPAVKTIGIYTSRLS
jgi:transposase InsO family protein